jgi:hypothetical protein
MNWWLTEAGAWMATIRTSEGDPEPLRNGVDRPVGSDDNGWTGGIGSWIQYDFGKIMRLDCVRRLSHLITGNRRRLVRLSMGCAAQAVRFIPVETWGDPQVRIFAFDISEESKGGKYYEVMV